MDQSGCITKLSTRRSVTVLKTNKSETMWVQKTSQTKH